MLGQIGSLFTYFTNTLPHEALNNVEEFSYS